MANPDVAALIDVLKDLDAHKKGEIAEALDCKTDYVRRLRAKAEKDGWRIPWCSEGYFLVPTEKKLNDLRTVVRLLDYVSIVSTMEESWTRKVIEAGNLKKLIDPTLLSTIYKDRVKEHVPYIPGRLVEMQNLLSQVHRELLKGLPYPEFLWTRYWSIVRSEKVHGAIDGQCEYCEQEPGTDVHHITYAHHGWEDEHLDDLIFVCGSCHESLEAEKEVI